MFPKGPRFDPPRIPDVPGPNSYNLAQDSQLDAYKRGAFLEKTDRFSAEKASDVPGPGTYNTDVKKTTTKATSKHSALLPNLADRYAILQRKVEDLEKLHNDGKKSWTISQHQNDVDRLKLELLRSQKSNADHTERIEKQKKQNETLDLRIQEFKKAACADQAEIKDLRVKLRMSEHERMQLTAKYGEAAELRKALQALESKRRDGIREREWKIAELEKSVAGERKKSESAEARLREMKGKGDEDIQAVRAVAQNLQGQVNEAQNAARQAQMSLGALQEATAFKEEALLAQLEQHRSLLGKVAQEYARLASITVATSIHSRVKAESTTLQMHVLRLERKLANSEEQVVELANFIRQTKEQNSFLAQRLRDVEEESGLCWHALLETKRNPEDDPGFPYDRSLENDLAVIGGDILASRILIPEVCARGSELSSDFYRVISDELLFMYSIADEEVQEQKAVAQQHAVDLSSALATRESFLAQLEIARAEREMALEQLNILTESMAELKSTSEILKRSLAEMEGKMRADESRNEELLKKEREAVQRLTGTVQMNRMAEDGLRAEIEQLTLELTDTERYQEAYYSLVDEVGSLVACKALAEDEAANLSKFNAEILGHNNPAQRIMYVDRIRRELAETKHKLVMSTREHEAVIGHNDDLRHELDMYKSVIVPIENKPRTNITRTGRPPLVNLNQSFNVGTNGPTKIFNGGNGEKDKVQRGQILNSIPGDMTLEEIM